ncbi:hypothetical protein D0T51_07200 [Parabacteroides sp. 52]|uniref:hypothetical protein n=1 Tax=unclassified Parabacteroides TaxID=2649774 RepID=UPI0013D16E6F|nr:MULTISPECIES: hypothetical protein [unclassified Parabacteroides]MDH6535085.1 hypothetical protein [Parabacteroides sp. PM5-20]NDV55515.1 hypothetical protein [Parabacteroides sp. 52]
MKVTLKILLTAAVILLVYMCYKSIMGPIEFNEERDLREKAIIARLIDIRKAQIEYKNVNKVHAGSFADLENFLNETKLPFIMKEGVLTDEQLEKGMTEQEAVKKGLIVRDTIWVVAKDTLFEKGYDVNNMRYVPAVPGDKIEFSMDTATLVSTSGYEIKVFESGVKFADYMRGMDAQLRFNLIEKAEKQSKYPGLRVGSLEEVNNNAGNWE